MFTDGLLPAVDEPLADAFFFFTSLATIPVAIAGIVFNVVNILVFAKQNLNEPMNITLLALAVADFWGVLASLTHCVFINPVFIINKIPVEPIEVMLVVSSYPRLSFSRVSMWLILYVAFERCLCVTMPLKVKAIVTKTRTKIFVGCSFVLGFVLFSPLFIGTRLAQKFSSVRNRTVVGFLLRPDFDQINALTGVANAIFTFTSFGVVVILTVVLVVRLNQKTKWRTEHSSSGNDATLVTRDRKLVKMVLIIDIILIICYFPSVFLNLFTSVYPKFTITGKYESIFYACWNVAFFLESINSTFNIFVYYSMSSKFKTGLQKQFPFLAKNEQESTAK